MPVVLDAADTSPNWTNLSAPQNWNHVPVSALVTTAVCIVSLYVGSANLTPPTVTYGYGSASPTTMTVATSTGGFTNYFTGIYVLGNLGGLGLTGTQNLQIQFAGTSNYGGAGVYTFTGGDTVTPYDYVGTPASGTGTSPSSCTTTTSAATGDMIIDSFAATGGTWAPGGSQIEPPGFSSVAASSYISASGTSQTMTWSNSGAAANWLDVVVSIKGLTSAAQPQAAGLIGLMSAEW